LLLLRLSGLLRRLRSEWVATIVVDWLQSNVIFCQLQLCFMWMRSGRSRERPLQLTTTMPSCFRREAFDFVMLCRNRGLPLASLWAIERKGNPTSRYTVINTRSQHGQSWESRRTLLASSTTPILREFAVHSLHISTGASQFALNIN
jgi:hypothetical protein